MRPGQTSQRVQRAQLILQRHGPPRALTAARWDTPKPAHHAVVPFSVACCWLCCSCCASCSHHRRGESGVLAVRISQPVAVMMIWCSNCALHLPSSVTAVLRDGFRGTGWVMPCLEHQCSPAVLAGLLVAHQRPHTHPHIEPSSPASAQLTTPSTLRKRAGMSNTALPFPPSPLPLHRRTSRRARSCRDTCRRRSWARR